jgi:uncharacterized protein (DUF2235 family)
MQKTIVVCYDGTGNEYGPNNTNVVGIYNAIVRNAEQVAFYDPGVGTFSFLGRYLGKKIGILLGKAFGLGLVENVEDGYTYLMNTHRPGDKVFIFGFSRGAFTARVLAAMIHKVGILQKGSMNLIPYATEIYFGTGNEAVAAGFKSTYCHECKTHFVGVWDTVASLGHFFGKKFKDNRLNPDVAFGRHAISIDEMRKKFPVSLWDESALPERQSIEQVWFAGVHSDVGGWYDERGLSDIALIWMVEQAERAGLRLKDGWKDNLSPNPAAELHNSRQGFWRLWRPAPRPIPANAKIHDSVRQRKATKPDYKPPNLRDDLL